MAFWLNMKTTILAAGFFIFKNVITVCINNSKGVQQVLIIFLFVAEKSEMPQNYRITQKPDGSKVSLFSKVVHISFGVEKYPPPVTHVINCLRHFAES